MMILEKTELLSVEGGINITGTLLNSLTRGITVVMDVGRALGSSIRRALTGNLCGF